MLQRSRSHLRSAGESYLDHMRFAGTVGAMAVAAGVAALIHAVVPGLCERSCSRTVALLQRLFQERNALPQVAQEASGAITLVGLLTLSILVAAPTVVLGGIHLLPLLMASAAFAIPAAYLISNPELEPLES